MIRSQPLVSIYETGSSEQATERRPAGHIGDGLEEISSPDEAESRTRNIVHSAKGRHGRKRGFTPWKSFRPAPTAGIGEIEVSDVAVGSMTDADGATCATRVKVRSALLSRCPDKSCSEHARMHRLNWEESGGSGFAGRDPWRFDAGEREV